MKRWAILACASGTKRLRALLVAVLVLPGAAYAASPAEPSAGSPTALTNSSAANLESPAETRPQNWNWHAQSTAIVQGYPGFSAEYSGPNSLRPGGQVRETISLDLTAGARLWRGAEAHIDGLMWQGLGLSQTRGVEGFPNGEAFRSGVAIPNVNIPRLLIRQTIGLGGEPQVVEDDALHLRGVQDTSRVTFTLGRMSAKDIFDNNAYANDPRTQFLNWGLMANEAWDYPADSLGYTTGFAAELYQPTWALRYGFFQMPPTANGVGVDPHYLEAWGMVSEFERSYVLNGRPGAVRLLAFLNQANMGSLQDAVDSPVRPADIQATRAYRFKYGFGLNFQQELTRDCGVFLRLGWNDGKTEAWIFADVDRTASLGLSLKGTRWGRPLDVVGLAGLLNGISPVHRDFFAAGGTGILAGDGRLTYGLEQILETYYDAHIWRTLRGALDYQFINHPAYNRDRGPVSVFAARLHWDF